MFFHLILTSDCNLQCRYCFGESLDDFDEDFDNNTEINYDLPNSVNYNLSILGQFCRQDSDCVLTFYGGEPLLQMDKICQIMNKIEPKHYMIQTNGLLLDKLESEYVNRFHTILVSIDGEEAITDYYRGKGTFRKVMDNLRHIKNNGFNGELIARMTVMEYNDIEKQVKWLLNNDEFCFSSVHWQLNAGFWGSDYQRRDFEEWTKTSYIPGVDKLADFWVEQMTQKGVVLKLYPLLGIANSLLHKEKTSLMRCGAGWINYAIQTDGNIIPCPTMWGMKKYYLGHIKNSNPLALKKIFVNQKPCNDCKILDVCGGRCLYANITKRWPDDEYSKVCYTVKSLIGAVEKNVPIIEELIRKGKIRLEDFDYIKYNGAEIIP